MFWCFLEIFQNCILNCILSFKLWSFMSRLIFRRFFIFFLSSHVALVIHCVLGGLFLCVDICLNEIFFFFFLRYSAQLFNRLIIRELSFVFQGLVPNHKFLLSFCYTTGASGISEGQCHLSHEKHRVPQEGEHPLYTPVTLVSGHHLRGGR